MPTPAEGLGLAETGTGAESSLPALTADEARSRLERVPEWSLAEDSGFIECAYSFGGPGSALAAVAYLAGAARLRGWCETLELSGHRVRVRLRSAAGGRVTAAEFLAAREVTQAVQRLGAARSVA